MRGRLGQFEDFYEYGGGDWYSDFGFEVPAFEIPSFDLPAVETGDFVMEEWIDPATGQLWMTDDTGTWFNMETGQTWGDPALQTELFEPTGTYDPAQVQWLDASTETGGNWSYTDSLGNQIYVDQYGTAYAVTGPDGVTSWVDGAGGVVEQTSADGSQTTAPTPTPTITNPTTGAPMSFPSLKDLTAFAKEAAGIYKSFTSSPTGAPRPGIDPRTGQSYPPGTRLDPRTGQPYPTGTGRPMPTGTAAQLIPGVPNQTLLIGAGVVGLAFLLAQRRGSRRR